tara:strand:- start:28855 stop:29361 length:507 start_codon:yes stop_codon:yes gene_type:complete
MKKILFITIITLTSLNTFSQKFAYVDSDYILKKIPEFIQAEEKINKLSSNWQSEIENAYIEIEKLYRNYQNEQVLLTNEMKTKREEEIIEKEKEVQSLQKKYFGIEGELYKKRQELIKPIQDRIYDAIQQLAINNKYSIIFDSSSDLIMLYTNPDLDKSDKVIELMGY